MFDSMFFEHQINCMWVRRSFQVNLFHTLIYWLSICTWMLKQKGTSSSFKIYWTQSQHTIPRNPPCCCAIQIYELIWFPSSSAIFTHFQMQKTPLHLCNAISFALFDSLRIVQFSLLVYLLQTSMFAKHLASSTCTLIGNHFCCCGLQVQRLTHQVHTIPSPMPSLNIDPGCYRTSFSQILPNYEIFSFFPCSFSFVE